MSVKQFTPPKILSEMRETGRSLQAKGAFETNLSTGSVTWTNSFALEKLGYEKAQLQKMTVYDLVPTEFHDKVSDGIADSSSGKHKSFSIWPTRTSDGRVAWWYVYQTRTEFPITWSFAEFVQTTNKEGIEYTFMRVTMETANSYGVLHSRVEEIDQWIHDQVDRLDLQDQKLEESITSLNDKMKHTMNAATRAANASLESAQGIRELKDSVTGQLEKHEEEIVKLISTDVHHDRRLEAFEKHVEKTTDVAIKSITTQADKAGKGLSRKITIPVSAIAVIATLVQWILTHYFPHGK